MSSKSFGYSNAAYCNMYDNDDDQDDYSLYQSHNETFVDEFYDQDLDLESEQRSREPPLGASGSLRFAESSSSTPNSTPRKQHPHRRRQRSFSAPRHQNTATVNVLAPMIAQARSHQEHATQAHTQQPSIRRSRSAVFYKDAEDRRVYQDTREFTGQRGHPSRKTISVAHGQGHRVTPARVHCEPFPRAQDTSLPYYDTSLQTRQCLIPASARKSAANLAIIPPNTRPLLPPSPRSLNTDFSPKKASWATLPLTRTSSNNTLRLSGLFLLFTGTVNCLLCFYLLAKVLLIMFLVNYWLFLLNYLNFIQNNLLAHILSEFAHT